MADPNPRSHDAQRLSAEEAKQRVWLVDINSLVSDDMKDAPDYSKPMPAPPPK